MRRSINRNNNIIKIILRITNNEEGIGNSNYNAAIYYFKRLNSK